MLKFIYMINIQGTELNFSGFEKYIVKIGYCLDAYEPISFKLGIMIDMNWTF